MRDHTAAIRQQRFRARRRQGVRLCASIEITPAIAIFLQREGWIGPAQLADRLIVEQAMADLIECLAEGRLVRRNALRALDFDDDAKAFPHVSLEPKE